jgi:CRP-like cAMP-binding protein
MKRLAIILIIVSIFLLTGCENKRDLYILPEDAKIEINNKTIEVFKSYKLYDLIGNTNMEINTKDTNIDTETIGEHTITLDLKYNKKKYKYDLKYIVKDLDAPRFIQASSSRSTLLTQVIDPCESIITGDNYDAKPNCRIDGNIDFTTLGNYNVEYVLTDSSNNETRKKLTIHVLDKYPTYNNTPSPKTYTYIENVMNTYKNDSTSIGIDVSRYQGNIDWDLVEEAGIEFVIMRIGVQTSPTETLDVDTKFVSYFEEAKKRGFKVGVYVYNTSISRIMNNKHFNSYKEGLDLEFLREYCMEHGEVRTFLRGETLEVAGETAQWVAYVERGCFKYMVHNDEEGKDYCTGFAFEGEFVADYPNCLSGKISEVTIVAGTSCKVFQIQGKDLCSLLESANMRDLKQAISDHLLAQVYTQYLDSYRMTTRERYKRLLSRCPEIVQCISLKDIASYLKVTPTTISNIRREITFSL